jgi:hypothetical protein
MNAEEIAKKLCEYSYLKHCDLTQGTNTTYLFEKYWETNKKYFSAQATPHQATQIIRQFKSFRPSVVPRQYPNSYFPPPALVGPEKF